MIPGPILIIPCPVCRHPGKQNTLCSGNTMGAQLWSDGKRIAPMLPEYPDLVKCKKCGSFFHLDERTAVGEYSSFNREEDRWPDVKFFKFPSFNEYFEALGTDIDELYIRQMAFRSYNDYIRNNKESKITANMQDLYFDNLKSLLYLLRDEEPDNLFSLIEINRQLGRFEKCIELLDTIDDNEGGDIKKAFLNEVMNKNTRLFRIY